MTVAATLRLVAALMMLVMLIGQAHAGDAPTLTTPAGDIPGVGADLAVPRGTVVSDAAMAGPSGRDPTLGALPPALTATAPGLTIRLDGDGGQGLTTPVMLLLSITVLSIAPGFLMMMTAFTRIIIVLGFLRRALGTQTLPPNQVMLGLALFLTMFIMAPNLKRINDMAVQPYLAERISAEAAADIAKNEVRGFMLKHTRKNDLALFIRLAGDERPRTAADVGFLTLVPAFMTSELKTAFQMGFILFLPFLVIDLVISAVLMALGMMMLPPVVVSLPFKILLFVLVDGWTLLMQGLVASYR